MDSLGTFIETLSYHVTIDYTLAAGERYTIEVTGWNFSGNIEQFHTPPAKIILHWFCAGELVGVLFLSIALTWFYIVGASCAVGVDEAKARRAKRAKVGD